jgi:hypothetical protein
MLQASEVWTALLTGVIAPSALLLGQYWLRRRRRPKLSLRAQHEAGFCVFRRSRVNQQGDEDYGCWLRVRVANMGLSAARDCQVFIVQYGPHGSVRHDSDRLKFDPIPLNWAHTDELAADRKSVAAIAPLTHRYADLLFLPQSTLYPLYLASTTQPPEFLDLVQQNGGLELELMAIDGEGHSDFRIARFSLSRPDCAVRWL